MKKLLTAMLLCFLLVFVPVSSALCDTVTINYEHNRSKVYENVDVIDTGLTWVKFKKDGKTFTIISLNGTITVEED